MKINIRRSETVQTLSNRLLTEMVMLTPKYRLKISIEGALSKELRRSVLLIVFRSLKPLLRLKNRAILHAESEAATHINEFIRPASMVQALELSNEAQKRGALIRLRRLKVGLTQQEFAKHAGISGNHLSKIEKGSFNIREKTSYRIEKAFESLESE
jgi:DNA-binding XRE family transcriptional regulator